MKCTDFQEAAKQKKKEYRMQISRIKEKNRQQNLEKQDRKKNRGMGEKYSYEELHSYI
jgi:hypothetical protein